MWLCMNRTALYRSLIKGCVVTCERLLNDHVANMLYDPSDTNSYITMASLHFLTQ